MKEYRRIQKTGESTFIVSLPKKWASLNNVDRGTEVMIQENEDGSLTLAVKYQKGESSCTIHQSSSIDRTIQKIIAAYLAGYEKIVLKGKDAAVICEDARSKLSGLEIIDEKADEGILSVLSKGDEFSIDDLLTRMHSISLTMFSLVIRSLQVPGGGKPPSATPTEFGLEKEVSRRETEIDRLFALALRTINTQSTKLSLAVCKARVAKTLERISDHAELLYQELSDNKQILNAITQLRDVYSEVFENLMQIENKEASILKLASYQKEIKNIIKKSGLSLRPALERCLRISDYLLDLVDITEDIAAIQNKK